jgi:hypothetical protein
MFSYLDISHNKLEGIFDTTKQNFFIDFKGNVNASINYFVMGQPIKYYNGTINESSIYECYSVYSYPLGDKLYKFNCTKNLNDYYKIEIGPEKFNYSTCLCTTDYYVKKNFFF